ncbi:MAG: DUF192 domain-containing protein [Candidatus Woesearchaeota archaeon]
MNTSITAQGKLIAEHAKKVRSILGKTKGLMFQRKVKNPLIFVFTKEQYVPLHMWFVFTSIDVLFLDKTKTIVEIKEQFKPWHYYSPKKKAMYVIELQKGTVQEKSIHVGTKLTF